MKKDLVLPNHIGIILDGNGRWAKKRGLIRSLGHKAGFENCQRLLKYMSEVGVKYTSLYVFSTENFKRDQDEVDYLMNIFVNFFEKEFDKLLDLNAKVVFSGRGKPLPDKVLNAISSAEEKSKDNTGMVINVCINYGGQWEIVDTTRKICEMYKNGEIELDDINPEFIQHNLYKDLPPVDYIIRTSGELRLSNFMLYQASYAEFYFPDVLFPDFNEEEFDKAIEAYNNRDRRFGGIKK